MAVKIAVHGHRRGLRPLAKRLSAAQADQRATKIEERKLEKALAKVQSKKRGKKA